MKKQMNFIDGKNGKSHLKLFSATFLLLGILLLTLIPTVSAELWDDIFNSWKFDESSGTNADNEVNVSNVITLTVENNTWVSAKLDNGIEFNASGGYGTSDGDMLPQNNFSFSMWINVSEITSDGTIFDERAGGKNFFFYKNGANIQFWNGGYITITNVSKNSWEHLVFIYNGTGIEVWKNGSLAYRSDETIANNVTGKEGWIGSAKGAESFYNGSIDEFTVFSRVLTASDVSDLWNSGNGLTYSRDLNLTITGESYDTTTTGGNEVNFQINITVASGLRLSSAILIYNGTSYSSSNTVIGNNYTINRMITTPRVLTNTNLTFRWNMTLDNDQTKQSTPHNQTLTPFQIDDCSTYTNVLYNFSIVGEVSQVLIPPVSGNTTARVDLEFKTLSGVFAGNFSQLYNETNTFAICLGNNLSTGEGYLLDLQLEYDADGYAKEFYHIQRETITFSDLNTNITLYDLLDTSSQEFKITYKNSNLDIVPGALIQIQRKYVDEGVFKTVEIPKISGAGYTIGHMVRNDVVYNLIVLQNGVIIASFNNVVANCQTPTLQDCEININSFATSVDPHDFTTDSMFTSMLSYNKDTRTVSTTFAIVSGTTAYTTLNVTLFDNLGNTTICSDGLNAAGGTLSCVIPPTFGNSSVIVKVYSGGELKREGIINLQQDASDLYGGNLVFLAIMILLLFVGMGVTDNPLTLGFMVVLGGILLIAINIIQSPGWIGTGATILWFIIAVVIILIKGANR